MERLVLTKLAASDSRKYDWSILIAGRGVKEMVLTLEGLNITIRRGHNRKPRKERKYSISKFQQQTRCGTISTPRDDGQKEENGKMKERSGVFELGWGRNAEFTKTKISFIKPTLLYNYQTITTTTNKTQINCFSCTSVPYSLINPHKHYK